MPITLQREASRIYLVGDTFPIKDQIKKIGGHWDGDRRAWWVGAAKANEAEALANASSNVVAVNSSVPKPKQNPDDIRLIGKGEYKGRTYFMGSTTRDGMRVRLLTLPDDKGEFLDFWADIAAVKTIKTYSPREERGRYGRGTGRMVYTTLGSIADFVAGQKKAEANGVPQCPVCGKRNSNMVHDLETGMECCRGCADMPAD